MPRLILELKKDHAIYVVESGIKLTGLGKTGTGMRVAIEAPPSLAVLRQKLMTRQNFATFNAIAGPSKRKDTTDAK